MVPRGTLVATGRRPDIGRIEASIAPGSDIVPTTRSTANGRRISQGREDGIAASSPHANNDKLRALLTIGALLMAGSLQAATFVVTRGDDPAPDSCQIGDCSLREAVLAANAAPGADRVELPGIAITLSQGELAITGELEIIGAGREQTTLFGDGGQATTVLRALAGAELVVRDLAIDGPEPALLAAARGSLATAVALESPGSLTLTRTDISPGGGLVHGRAGSIAQVNLDDSELFGLLCDQNNGHCVLQGSTVQLLAVRGGDVTVRDSAISGALRPLYASGASIETTGHVLIEDSTIADTHAGLSFQSRIPERTDLRRVRYLRNGEPLLARLAMVLWITDSEFADNHNRWTGDNGGPGAIHAYLGAIFHVARTSFINNRGSGDAGGAILVESNASLWLSDSTFSGNSFSAEAAGEGARGAAVAVRAGNTLSVAEIVHATVVEPPFLPTGMSGTAFAVLGADAQVHFAVHNSIVRGSCDFGLVPGHMDFAEGNIKSTGGSCGFDAGSNQIGVSTAQMALGTLGDHGGFAWTYLPGAASVAIDTAVIDRCSERDQRGFQRPWPGPHCDVGAVEVGAGDRLFADDFED